MKDKISKKKPHVRDVDEKFIEEQKYAEQEFHLEDPKKDIPEFPEEKGISAAEEESKDNEEFEKRD